MDARRSARQSRNLVARAGNGRRPCRIQVDSAEELGALAGRLKAAGAETFDQEATTCCYARSDKSWVSDPAGVRWETFFTHGEATDYGEDEMISPAGACCGARQSTKSACC